MKCLKVVCAGFFIPAVIWGLGFGIGDRPPEKSMVVQATGDENWDSRFMGFYLDGTVWSVGASGTDVYVGGGFTRPGGVAASNIAKWDGSNWAALGSGVNGTVRALAISGTDIFAGGWFTEAGGAPANLPRRSASERRNGTPRHLGRDRHRYAGLADKPQCALAGARRRASGKPGRRRRRRPGTSRRPHGRRARVLFRR